MKRLKFLYKTYNYKHLLFLTLMPTGKIFALGDHFGITWSIFALFGYRITQSPIPTLFDETNATIKI